MPRAKKTVEFDVVNLSLETPTDKQKSLFGLNKDFIPFGSDNLFPQALALLLRKSPVHRAIITNKAYYIGGDGFTVEDGADKLWQLVQSVNSKESLSEVMHKLVIDKNSFGNAYIEIVKIGGVASYFHTDATKCRLNATKTGIIIHPDWSKYNNTKKDAVTIPLYPTFARVNGALRSMVHIKSYEPEFVNYGLPQAVASIDAATIAYKTNKWNLSRLDNSFQSSGILLVDGNMSADDAAKLKKKFKEEFTGEGNQGKVLFIAQNLGGSATTSWQPITNGSEGDWMNLHKQTTDELITAHNWYPSLSGIATAGALGNNQQIRNEYQIALNTVIGHEQGVFLKWFKRLLKEQSGLETESLAIVNKPPVSLLDRVDLNSALKKWEIRKMAGVDFDEEDPAQQDFNTVKDGQQPNNA